MQAEKKSCLSRLPVLPCQSLIPGKENWNLLPRRVAFSWHARSAKHGDRRSNDPEYESRVQDALPFWEI